MLLFHSAKRHMYLYEVEVELDDEFDDDEQIEMGKGQKTESGFTLVSPACT